LRSASVVAENSVIASQSGIAGSFGDACIFIRITVPGAVDFWAADANSRVNW